MIAAVLALVAVAPAGALAATEESGGGSTSGETVVESPGSTEPAPATPPAATAPASPGWTPQGAGTGTSSDEAAPIRRGSSVGSGGAPEKAETTSEEPSYTTGSTSEESSSTPGTSGSYESNPSTPSIFDEPTSSPRAESGIRSVEPPAITGGAVEVGVGAAAPLTLSKASQGGDNGSGTPVAAETFAYSGDEEASGSYVLPLLVVAALGLLGYAGVRLRHLHLRRRREALWRRQDAVWEATVRQIEMRRAIGALKPSAERLQKIDVG